MENMSQDSELAAVIFCEKQKQHSVYESAPACAVVADIVNRWAIGANCLVTS